jgi:hypothetical protein
MFTAVAAANATMQAAIAAMISQTLIWLARSK